MASQTVRLQPLWAEVRKEAAPISAGRGRSFLHVGQLLAHTDQRMTLTGRLADCWRGGLGCRRAWTRVIIRGRGSRVRVGAGRGLGGAVFLLRIELRILLHALLHVTEVVNALRALHLLFTVMETGKGLLELRATRSAGHAPQARAVPVDVTIGQDQTLFLIRVVGVIRYQLCIAWCLMLFLGHKDDAIFSLLSAVRHVCRCLDRSSFVL